MDTRYAKHASGAARYHCDTKIVLPEIVVAFDIALPVRRDLQRPLSWSMTIGKEMGNWHQEKELARQMFIQTSACDATSADASSLSLTFETGAGIVFISFCLTTIALVANACWRPYQSRAAAETQVSSPGQRDEGGWLSAEAADRRVYTPSETELSRATLPARTTTMRSPGNPGLREADLPTANTKWVL